MNSYSYFIFFEIKFGESEMVFAFLFFLSFFLSFFLFFSFFALANTMFNIAKKVSEKYFGAI